MHCGRVFQRFMRKGGDTGKGDRDIETNLLHYVSYPVLRQDSLQVKWRLSVQGKKAVIIADRL